MRGVRVGEVVAQPLERGIDVLRHGTANRLAAGLVGHVGQDDRRGNVGRHRQHAVDLLDRLPDRDRCGGPAVRDPLVQGPDVLLDERGEPGEAGQHPLRLSGVSTRWYWAISDGQVWGPDMWFTAAWYSLRSCASR